MQRTATPCTSVRFRSQPPQSYLKKTMQQEKEKFMKNKPKYFFITYADSNFRKQLAYSSFAAKYLGKFDKIFLYGPRDIDLNFREKFKKTLDHSRGGGLWLWKPYLILKTLKEAREGDFIFYSDAGAFITYNIQKFVSFFNEKKQDIFCFEIPLIEKQWTKEETMKRLDPKQSLKDTNQICGGYILIRKSKASESFFSTFLETCCDTALLDDSLEEEKDYFIDHRHDQSILSLLYKKNNFQAFKDPSQFGIFPRGYAGCKDNYMEPDKLYNLSSGRLFRSKKYEINYCNKPFLISFRLENPLVLYARYLIKKLFLNLGIIKKI